MRRRLETLLFLTCICFVVEVASALAQAPAFSETRVAPVSVVDRDGKPVLGLTAANFKGEFRGQPVRIEDVTLQGGQRHIAVLLDVSISIKKNPTAWELAWAAAQDLMLTLQPPHLFSMVTVSDKAIYRTAISAGVEQDISAALRGLEAEAQTQGGTSSLFDAMLGVSELKLSGRPPDLLYVISDGIDNTSRNGVETVEAKLAASGVRPFFLLLPPVDEPYLARLARKRVRRIAEACGGRVIDFSRGEYNKTDPFASTRPLYDSMIRPYAITVALPVQVDRPREWKLEVVDERGKKLKNVELAYPHLLVPLSGATTANE